MITSLRFFSDIHEANPVQVLAQAINNPDQKTPGQRVYENTRDEVAGRIPWEDLDPRVRDWFEQDATRPLASGLPFAPPTQQMFRCDRPQGVSFVRDETITNGVLSSLWRSDGGTEYVHIESFAGASWWRLEVIGG